MTKSKWRLTHDPTGAAPAVLVDYGNLIDGDLEFQSVRGFEVVPIIIGSFPFLKDQRNVSLAVEFSVFIEDVSHTNNLTNILGSLVFHNSAGKKPLRIEVEGVTDRYWQAAQCVVSDVSSRERVATRGGRITTYALTMAGMEEITV